MPRGRRNGSRAAVYVVTRAVPGAPEVVVGTVVSRPADVRRDVPRLFGPHAAWRAWSACPAWLRRKARQAEAGGLPGPAARAEDLT